MTVIRVYVGGPAASLLVMLVAAPWLLGAEPVPPPGWVVERDVVYGKGGGVNLHLDLVRPEKPTETRPCLIFVHGGGWKEGNKSAHLQHAINMASKGYVAATVQYRLAPKYKFPAQVEDVKCAVRYLRAHATQYGINPKKFGAIGVSAGGHLVMMLGTLGPFDGLEGEGGWADHSSRVQCVVSFVGPTDLGADDIPTLVKPLIRDFLGGLREEMPEVYKRASPLTYVSGGDAPMLLFAGTRDILVPHTQAVAMANALTKEGVPGRVELLLLQGHGFEPHEYLHCAERMNEFLDRYLKGK